jgi:hypothetical protein
MTADYLDDPFARDVDHELSEQIDEVWFPVCPRGLPQRVRRCLGYYERDPGRVQLRFAALDDEGLCDVLIDERDSHVVVRVVICRTDDPLERYPEPGLAEERTHAYLQAPLAGRPLIDFETGEPVPFYVPTWLDGHRTKAPGYYTDRQEVIVAAELLPRSADDRPLRIKGALARSRSPRW